MAGFAYQEDMAILFANDGGAYFHDCPVDACHKSVINLQYSSRKRI
jgi:hypothetical protein